MNHPFYTAVFFNIAINIRNVLTCSKVSCLETALFTRYSVNYCAQTRTEKIWDFRETHAREDG